MTARAEQRIASLNDMMSRKPIEHGKRVSYMQGCRCLPCRAANARHAAERALRRAQGKADPLVGSAGVRGHIRWLSALGIGSRQIAKASGVSNSIIWEIRHGSRPNIRTSTERRILAVDTGARAGHALVDAAPMWTESTAGGGLRGTGEPLASVPFPASRLGPNNGAQGGEYG